MIGSICALAIASLCGHGMLAHAQAPLLSVSVISQGDGKGYKVAATNNYSSPATELIVQVTYWRSSSVACGAANRGADGRCHFTVHRHMIPSAGWRGELGSVVPARWLIQPKETVPVTEIGPQAVGIASATNVAVIYDDGAVAGDRGVLRQMLAQRRHDLVDAEEALTILNKAAADPATDLTVLAASFSARAHLHRAQMDAARDPEIAHLDRYGPSGDPVCTTIAMYLKRGRAGEVANDNAAALSAAIRFTNGHIALLQAGAAPAQ
ncbi:MAG TPA: hypothetical protein VN709_00045 [Terriglobales bacterium]|nr:hypothetical protein [Terriglobales bacterium]